MVHIFVPIHRNRNGNFEMNQKLKAIKIIKKLHICKFEKLVFGNISRIFIAAVFG